MREIKFRAWFGRDKVLVYNCVQWTPAENGEWLLPLNECNFVTKDCVPMQYTGLHDKNGKEIYEGDVVKLSWDYYPYSGADDCEKIHEELVGIIDFESGSFWFHSRGLAENSHFHYNDSNREVIGNIYENKELLEVSHANLET